MRRLLTITALCATLTACDTLELHACTEIGAPVGIGLDIRAPLAARAAVAEVEVCWSGSCRTAKPPLQQSYKAGQQTCTGDTCSASSEPTADKNAFADVPGLPKAPVEVRLVLRDGSGAQVLDKKITLTPKGQFPNGPDCGEGGPQAGVVVEGDGAIHSIR